MKISKIPLILSFEYSNNERLLKNILDYINYNKIKTVLITNLPPLKFIKKINACFISIDINLSDLNFKKIELIKNYNQYVHQIRLIIEDPIENKKLNNYLKKIKNNYFGSKVLFYKISIPFLDKNTLLTIIKKSYKYDFTLSLLPIETEIDSSKYKLFIKMLFNFTKEIRLGKILIDSPYVLKKITKKEYVCPAISLMCHINTRGNFNYCKFGNYYMGNIKNKPINKLWKKKEQIIKNFLKNTKNKNECLTNILEKKIYSSTSTVYDKVFDNKKIINNYATFIKSNFPDRKLKILDVACGTGSLIEKLKENYNYIEGLDLSKEMTLLAKKKTGEKIYHDNMVNFKLNKKYDLILCTFDSLNYLLSKSLLKKTFKNFYLHLNTKGVIIFDINTLRKFKKHLNVVGEKKFDNSKIKWISSYNRPFWKITIKFVNNNTWQETHYERFYPLLVIKKLLKECGFKNIKIMKKLMKKNFKNKKVFFIAQK